MHFKFNNQIMVPGSLRDFGLYIMISGGSEIWPEIQYLWVQTPYYLGWLLDLCS